MKKIYLIAVAIIIALGVYALSQNHFANNNKESNVNINNPENQNMNENQGLKIEVLREGAGEGAKNGDIVSVHYVGTLENGTKFDSSIDRGTPFSFTLGVGQVIQGWDQGVLGMKIGEKRKLTIPSDLAYGAGGVPGAIPSNATLIFEVELLGINQ